ncbi:Peptidoglycan recognition protein SC2 [Carabus blaptoides fortunei]
MYKFLVVFALGTAVLIQGCPRITGRSSWRARSPKRIVPMTGAAQYVVIHHTEGAQCHSENACARELRNIQSYHMSWEKNFTDIGYNFLIDHNGNVYEGRGWGISGEHAPRYNRRSVGISIIGNYQSNSNEYLVWIR